MNQRLLDHWYYDQSAVSGVGSFSINTPHEKVLPIKQNIAMLVAEEYERRVKNSRKIAGENEEIDLFSSVSVLARGVVEWSSWINRNIGEEKMELVKKAMEPRSQIGVPAINGFFSA
ncbi:hypothetical protein RHSIM_Rhsim10G0155200 [Rhododendron simsii]|uniref:Uncharacterized protein n=1 Tax=Rhododendron simsii TaxID=118357 RepID=A0A834G960_RHOSS|nr:hypothetical protein RHSIM_Rhsim10G0155200 [Rhododendron simsii]